MSKTIAAIVLTLALGACKKSDDAPKATPSGAGSSTAPDPKAAVRGGMDMLADIAKAIGGASDCTAKGKALQTWVDANADRMKSVGARLKATPPDQLTPEIDAQMKERPEVQAMFKDAMGCDSDAGFHAAWEQASAAFEPS